MKVSDAGTVAVDEWSCRQTLLTMIPPAYWLSTVVPSSRRREDIGIDGELCDLEGEGYNGKMDDTS